MTANRLKRGGQVWSWTAAIVCMSVVTSACTGGEHKARKPKANPVPVVHYLRSGRTTGPFSLTLSAGHPATLDAASLAVVNGNELDAAGIAKVVGHLPPFKQGNDGAEAFKRPPETLPRPRVGTTTEVPIGGAPRPKPVANDDGPLQVVRSQPNGDVDIAPDISVTFNQPMVPVGTLSQLDAAVVPVKVVPALQGHWRWIGTRTLRFQFAGNVDRLPMATSYSVEVPAGTASQTGKKLAKAVRWTFRTPPPKVLTFFPDASSSNDEQFRELSSTSRTVGRTPVFISTFDQRIDPAALLTTTSLKANGKAVAIRLATGSEVNADDTVHQISKDALAGRWFAFRPVAALPLGANLSIVIGPKTPSAEGPRVSTERSVYSTSVYSALKITESKCGYFEGCRPDGGFSITFNNALDAKKFDAKLITISPAVAAAIGAEGNTVTINAHTKRNTKYTVRVAATLRDEFGQTLGATKPLTFEVGDASPTIVAFSRPLITRDPSAPKPAVAVTSVGHAQLRVDVYAVEPAQWLTYRNLLDRWWQEQAPRVPFRKLSSSTIAVDGGGASLTESSIDLTAALPGGKGHVVVVVSSTTRYGKDDPLRGQNYPTITWVQSTSIGIDAVASNADLVSWATNLTDGAPIVGVTVQLGGTNKSAVTGADGVARVTLATSRYLTATKGNDVALLPADASYEWNPAWVGDSIAGVAFNDRGIYRPGETIHVKGWFRRFHVKGATISPLGGAKTARWTAHDAFGNELGHGDATLNGSSGFDFAVNVPKGVALGDANVDVQVNDGGLGGSANFTMQIQEFRRPEFEVITRTDSPGPHVLTQPVTLSAMAQYFSGGGLANAPVVWQVTSSKGTYSPPNWSAFTFGEFTPYWMEDGRFNYRGDQFRGGPVVLRGGIGLAETSCCFPQPDQQKFMTYNGFTDATGTHYLQLDFNGETPDLPLMVSANASATDVNRQSFASNLEVLVHPSTLYVGIRSTRQFVREGEPIDLEAIVTDIDGHVVAGRTVKVTAVRVVQTFVNGQWTSQDVDAQHCDVASTDKPVSCTIKAGVGGEYKISAVVTDDNGGRSRSQFTRYVSGAEAVPTRNIEAQQATIVPNQERYKPGDTAELLVVSPFANAEGLMTISANGVITTSRFTVANGSSIVKLPIASAYSRGVTVQLDLAGSAPRLRDDGSTDAKLPARPAFATASLPLHVEAADKKLTVTTNAQDPVTEPGAKETVDISVKGADGSAVAGADVAVVVVDDSVLSLTNYKLADPLAAMYVQQSELRANDLLRRSLVLANPAVFGSPKHHLATATSLPGADLKSTREVQSSRLDRAGNVGLPAFKGWDAESRTLLTTTTPAGQLVRTNFNAVALFSPSVRTDAAGVAHVSFDLPDNLTRYRVMAIAAGGNDAFGAGESTLTARIPLQVRPSAPRFANFGDAFEFPVVVQNQTAAPITTDVVLEASNLTIGAVHGRRVTVPANDRIEVRFPVTTNAAGTATFRVSATDSIHTDSALGSFPVYTPVTTEAFATYGVVDNGAIAQPLLTPSGVVPQYGGLEIDTSSTAVQALTDAVVYLENYEYDSVDAYASRIIALTSLRDVFAAFAGTGVPTPAKLDARIKADIQALQRLQNDDGGFGVWERGARPQPYMSVQAAEAFVLAKLAGYPVSDQARSGALNYIGDIESKFPPEWGPQERHATSAYALHVRNRAGDRDAAKAEALYRSDRALSLDALAWLWPIVNDAAIDGEIARTFANRVHENAGSATFTSGYTDGANLILGSDRRTDGIVLDALLTKQPTSDLIPKIVAGLVGNQVKGHWTNIQENSFILVALHRYFATFEAQTPAFVARVWLGETYAAEHSFQGRSIDRQHTLVPVGQLAGNPNIVIAKSGAGRLYYRLGLKYAPSDFSVPARDEGFVVDRVYEAVNSPSDVRRDANGVWHIKPGAMVRVRITMVADTNHTNMALVDSLPAGLESLNPALATSPRPPVDERPGDPRTTKLPMWYGSTWFDHENLRDDRAEAFSSYLYGGTFDYSYVARATTTGTFVVPPAKAEEIYAPEVFGRSASDRVVIG